MVSGLFAAERRTDAPPTCCISGLHPPQLHGRANLLNEGSSSLYNLVF